MDLLDLMARRESVRDYDPNQPLDPAVLTRILEAGRLAPSACNLQPWTFVVVQSPEALARVRACYPKTWFQEAPAILLVVGHRDRAWVRRDGYCSLETDLAIAMDHLILAAEAEGVATCWISNFDAPTLRQALDLQEAEVVFALTPLGFPRPGLGRRGEKVRRPLSEVVRTL